MFRLIFWVFTLAMMVAVAVFAAGNRGMVSLNLDPAPYVIDAPLYLVVMGAVAGGFLWGLIASMGAVFRARGRAREQGWEASRARREAAELRAHVEKLETARLVAPAPPAVPTHPS